ncbi:MAG: peptidoglycan editing factor PgeF [Clostridia bacterium]|nr:peptidoglycan editing factor PgeF [Clostridia bacterium]
MVLPVTNTLTPHRQGELLYYTFPAFDRLAGIRHGFSTRLGGVSEGIFQSMNLSFTRGDDPAAVTENFRRFCAAIGVEAEQVVVSAQTHTVNVVNVTAADCGRGVTRERGYTDVDGLITDQPGVVLCTQYADCVPLFFADPVRRVVATSHAGWRGTVAGMAAVTVERMVADYGCHREDILAAIGPSIGRCCFEVDTPVYTEFAKLPFFDEQYYTPKGGDKVHIDLWAVNRRFMLESGVKAENITVTDLCTRCHPDVFWSHRATGGQRGSLAAFIGLV